MKEDSMWLAWQEAAPRIYDKTYYEGNRLVSHMNNSGHWLLEGMLKADKSYSKVVEVGAGTGYHFPFVKHDYDQYIMTDISPDLLALAEKKYGSNKKVIYDIQDATNLKYEDDSVDRLISLYNLEHLPQPHLVLKEWKRVIKKGGVLSIAIPLEGGVAWRLGRYLTTRRSFAKEGLDLDYIIAREHINPAYNLISLIRYYFDKENRTESWYPFKLPLVDINLVYCCSITV